MPAREHTYEGLIHTLWDRRRMLKLAREFSQSAVRALEGAGAHVRCPGSDHIAAGILRRDAKPSNLASIVREIQEACLHLSHRRYVAQQVAAPIPAAALVESVVAALNQRTRVLLSGRCRRSQQP
jgi:hypothetical protein